MLQTIRTRRSIQKDSPYRNLSETPLKGFHLVCTADGNGYFDEVVMMSLVPFSPTLIKYSCNQVAKHMKETIIYNKTSNLIGKIRPITCREQSAQGKNKNFLNDNKMLSHVVDQMTSVEVTQKERSALQYLSTLKVQETILEDHFVDSSIPRDLNWLRPHTCSVAEIGKVTKEA